MIVLALFYKMRQHMPLQVVDVDHRNAQRGGEALGKAHAHEQRAHQTRTACEGHSTQFFLRHTCPFQRLIHYGYNI